MIDLLRPKLYKRVLAKSPLWFALFFLRSLLPLRTRSLITFACVNLYQLVLSLRSEKHGIAIA